MANFTLHTLGCGSAKPSLRHNPSCTVLNIRDRLYMIDCGEGAQKEFQRQHLKFTRLNHIFLTHLHGDHVLGLPGLLGTLALSKCGGEITIHTFADGIKILSEMVRYFCGPLPYRLNFHEIKPTDEMIFENKALTVRTIRLKHRVPTVGFVFEEKPKPRHLKGDLVEFHQVPFAFRERLKEGEDYVKPDGTMIPNGLLTSAPDRSIRYAHISDTAYMPSLAEKIEGVDLLMHETTYTLAQQADAAARGHSTAHDAAVVARDAGVGCLLTGHYSSRIHDEEEFLREAKAVFPNVILNREGLKIDL